MAVPRGIARLFRLAGRAEPVEQEVDAELEFHLESETARLMALGMRPEAARVEARRRFGDLGFTREVLVTIDQQRRGRERRAGWLEDLRPTAVLASLIPAWRASRIDPNLALRAE
jgi:putative ABC transport system permease protein